MVWVAGRGFAFVSATLLKDREGGARVMELPPALGRDRLVDTPAPHALPVRRVDDRVANELRHGPGAHDLEKHGARA